MFQLDLEKLISYFKKSNPQSNEYNWDGFHMYKCIFIHIPKTGGVSVSKSLFGNLGGGHRSLDYYRKLMNPIEYHEYFKFAIVRDPINRFLSAYNFINEGGYHNDDIEWRDKYMSKYQDINNFIDQELPIHLNVKTHFLPQTSFLNLDEKNLGLDYIGYFENLTNDFLHIAKQLNVRSDLQYLNKTSHIKFTTNHLNRKSIELLKEYYSDDYQYLKYKK